MKDPAPWFSTSKAKEALLAAAATWTAANPAVRFSFGTTTLDSTLGDRHNVISWDPTMDPAKLAVARVLKTRTGTVLEADVTFNALQLWSFTPCAQRNNSCTAASGAVGMFDVQAIATHEFGHVLGLGHLIDHAQGQPETADPSRELTMYAQPHPGERKQATLALGDVLAIRAAYPSRGRPLPPVYAP